MNLVWELENTVLSPCITVISRIFYCHLHSLPQLPEPLSQTRQQRLFVPHPHPLRLPWSHQQAMSSPVCAWGILWSWEHSLPTDGQWEQCWGVSSPAAIPKQWRMGIGENSPPSFFAPQETVLGECSILSPVGTCSRYPQSNVTFICYLTCPVLHPHSLTVLSATTFQTNSLLPNPCLRLCIGDDTCFGVFWGFFFG